MTRRPAIPVLAVLLAVIVATLAAAMPTSSAQTEDDEISEQIEIEEASLDAARLDEIGALREALVTQETHIRVLEEQLAMMRQTSLANQQRITNQRSTILAIQQSRTTDSSGYAELADEQWVIGYTLGGGQNLLAFQRVILPCESGGEPDPHAAVGPTDDWGRAQINRPTWSTRFTELTGFSFEQHIREPALNGFMAAVVEQEHPGGLNAWTCWRIRR